MISHRSLPGAGDVVQPVQIGASQVPLLRVGTFQSHSSVAGRPQGQRRPRVHTIATPWRVRVGVQGIYFTTGTGALPIRAPWVSPQLGQWRAPRCISIAACPISIGSSATAQLKEQNWQWHQIRFLIGSGMLIIKKFLPAAGWQSSKKIQALPSPLLVIAKKSAAASSVVASSKRGCRLPSSSTTSVV